MKKISSRKFFSYSQLDSEKELVRITPDGKKVVKVADCDLWHLEQLQGKTIPKVETPKDIYRMKLHGEEKIIYTTNFCDGYESFYNKPIDCTTRDYILFNLELGKTLRHMNDEELYSQDLINTKNLLVNPDYDYRFIDFDYSMVNGTPSWVLDGDLEGSYPQIYRNYPKKLSLIEQARLANKIVLLEFLIRGLIFGKVDEFRDFSFPIGEFPEEFEDEVISIFSGERVIEWDDYLEDLRAILLDSHYESREIENNRNMKMKRLGTFR